MGLALQQLTEWKAQPYQIIDEQSIEDLIAEKTNLLQEQLGISEDMAHALLLTNKWSTAQVMKEFSGEYLRKTFDYDAATAALTIQENREEEVFECPCCYCEYELDEAVEMTDCGHRLCTYCF